jgi:hypothetical protein
MAAVVDMRHHPHVKALYERLRAKGQSTLSALGACRRKLVHLCFGVIKNQTSYKTAFARPLTFKTGSFGQIAQWVIGRLRQSASQFLRNQKTYRCTRYLVQRVG